ncbi:hypothetical protein GGI35DRAFT_445858 [Trichoderma velutinum]
MPDMASSDPKPTHLTISKCATRCIGSFQRCLARAASIHARELALIENQLAKFSLWASHFQVFASGRESLDHRLLESFDIQDAIIGVVETLNYSVLKCTSILGTLTPVALDRPLPELNAKFSSALQDITKQIALLHKLSSIIRRVGRETRELKAVTEFKIEDNEGHDLEPFLKEDFARYIRNQFPGVSDIIQQRLVNTMTLRHKKVLYRRICCGKFLDRTVKQPNPVETTHSFVRNEANPSGDGTPPTAADILRSITQARVPLTTTLLFKHQKTSTPSDVPALGSVAKGDPGDIPFPPAPCGNIMRKYDVLKTQRRGECNLSQENEKSDPEVVKKYEKIVEKDWDIILEAAEEIDCPFCCLSLPARDVVDESKWKSHVKNDLDSYVCLFEGCESPEEVYNNSSTWLKHMSSHYMRWRCVSKSHVEFQSTTKNEYIDHMKVDHPGKFSDAQLNILAIRNARPTSSMFKPCPLCGNKEFDGNRADHVAGHLLLLALKSLPIYEDHIDEQKEVEYQQHHLSVSNTRLSKSAIIPDSRNDSNLTVRTSRTQASSISKKEDTTNRDSTRRQQQPQKNGVIAQQSQRWREQFNSQQDSFSTVHDSQQAATIFPIQEGQPTFEAALPTSYGEVDDAEASSNFHARGQTPYIEMAPQEYLREMEREREGIFRSKPNLAYEDIGLALRNADITGPASIIVSQHPSTSRLSSPTAMARDNTIKSDSMPRENHFILSHIKRENLSAPIDSSQDVGDVTQFMQSWADFYQKRNETSYRLTDSFNWDNMHLTDEGIPVFDRQHIVPGDGSPSSMNMNNFVQIMDDPNAAEEHDQWSPEPLLAMDRRNNDLGKLPQQQSTAQANLVIKRERDSMSLDETLPSSEPDDHGHIAGFARFGHRRPISAVELILDEMSTELDAIYRRITMGLDVSFHMLNIPDSADENLFSLSADADADIPQKHSSDVSDKQVSFMCPYAMRYPDHVNHSCFQRLNTIPYLKQHLRQNHHDTTNCPHQCQSRRSAAASRRRRPHEPLCFDSNACFQINKQRSDRSKTHRQQWERIYQILYPEADRIPDPYIGESTVKRLRSIFQFKENHGLKYLASIYPPGSTDPDAEVMHRTAFCKWLPQVFEWRFPPQGQQLLGDFLNQIKSVLRDNYYRLEYSSGASRGNVVPLSSGSQMDRHDPFYDTISQHGTGSSQQPSRHTNPPTSSPQQQVPPRSSIKDSLYKSQHDSSSGVHSYTDTVKTRENMDWAASISKGHHNIHHLSLVPQNSTQGSHSNFFTVLPAKMEGIETSQMGTWKSPF